MRAALLLMAAGLGAPAAAAQRDDPATELGNRQPGPEQACIDQDRVDGPIVFPGTVLFRQSGRRIWRMAPLDSCPSLRWDVHLQTFGTGRRLCRGDRFNVFPAGSPIAVGHCRMGGFVPYDKERS